MSNNEMIALVSQIKGLRAAQKDLTDKLTVLENQFKEAVGPDELDITIGGFHIILKNVESTRLDSKALRIDLGDDILDPYLSTVFSRRLTIK